MCSQLDNNDRSNLHNFQYTEEWHTTDEPWDTDDDNQYFPPGRSISSLGRSISSRGRRISSPDDLRRELQIDTKLRRAKSEQLNTSRVYSMEDKMKDWHNRKGELQAERYCKLVEGDTLEHLRDTRRSASSLLDKGTAINDELARQERVLSKAESDLVIANYDTDQTIETLKGMKSLRGKLASVLWKKEPKLRINDFTKDTRTFIDLNVDLLDEDVGLSAFSKMSCSNVFSLSEISDDTEVTQQMQIKAGVGQLHKALDAIEVQQVNTATALEQQERLLMFENRIGSTNQKIRRQTKLIGTIMGK